MLSRTYLEPGAVSGDYTFDSSKIDFNNSNPELAINRPAALSCLARYISNINLDYSLAGGSLTGTPTGAVIINNGKLDLTGGAAYKYVDYVATNNAASLQVGCMRVRITPNYSGTPATNQLFIRVAQANASSNNVCGFFHANTGQINLRIFNSSGASIITATLGLWAPVAGTTYEFEFNWDITTGATRLFIDGVQFGATQTATGTRSGAVALLRIGESQTIASNFANFSVEDVFIFSTVQHTANYTPAEFLDYSDTSPSIKSATSLTGNAIVSLTTNTEKPAGTDIKFTIEVDGVEYWFNTGEWVESTSPEESNDAFTEEQLELLDSGGFAAFRPVAYLISDGTDTPTLFSYIVEYLGYGFANVSGAMVDPDGSVPDGGRVRIGLTTITQPPDANIVIDKKEIISTVGAFGEWTANLIVGGTYTFYFERIINGVRNLDGKITKAITTAGPVTFEDL